MDDAIGSMVGGFLLLVGLAGIITMVVNPELPKRGWQWLVGLYKTAKPPIIEASKTWQPGQPPARKPDAIQRVGIEARDEIDQIMAYYHQQVDALLQTEGISPETPPEVILLSTQKYKEDIHVS
jgi:hypothetical protein